MDGIVIRRGRREDCFDIRKLIQELADYEKMSDGPKITTETLEKDGFGERPFFGTLVAVNTLANDEVVGYALYYYAYSTWEGKSMHLEDLYVQPSFRGRGIGKTLFQSTARIAVLESCKRVNFTVLNWNKPSIDFYKSLGAVDLTGEEGWLQFRLSGPNLESVAASSRAF